ncbi:MAG: DsrE family protein [Chitinophagaceae bacterium]|nr:DsrE family protein [Chitinophagaceae bacterium]
MKKIILLLLTLTVVLGGQAQKPTNRKKTYKIIFQLNSPDTLAWKGLINNLKNLKAGWGDSVMMAVVAHGPGLDFLVKDKTTQYERIVFFKNQGVEFIACENTMTERNIPKEKIMPEASFVKMGIAEIVRRQENGWTYIKAGF